MQDCVVLTIEPWISICIGIALVTISSVLFVLYYRYSNGLMRLEVGYAFLCIFVVGIWCVIAGIIPYLPCISIEVIGVGKL